MTWLVSGVALALLMSLLPASTAVPDHGFAHALAYTTGSPSARDPGHPADRSDVEHEALGAVQLPTPLVAPLRPASRWACDSPELRGVLIGYPKNRAGSCVSLALPSMVGALGGGNLNEDQVQALIWALDLFEQADMQLPTFLVSHEPEDACDGNAAVVNSMASLPHIRVCTGRTRAVSRWVMLHELGHIWTEWHVDMESRTLFLAARSLVEWRSDNWADSGTEHAAEVIVWALFDRPVRPNHLPNMSCIELAVAFRALTGERPLHGFTDFCRRD